MINVRFYLDLTDLKDKYILHDILLGKKKYVHIGLFSSMARWPALAFFLKFYEYMFKTKMYSSLKQVI